MIDLEFQIAEKDLAFIKGLEVEWSYGEGEDKVTLRHDVKVKQGEPFILDVKRDYVIRIHNHEDRWDYDKLFALNVSAIGGYDGMYADSEEEAFNLFADYCAEDIPDPDNPGHEKMRFPGFIASWSEAMADFDEDEQAVCDFYCGPYGNEGWYFTEGQVFATEVHDPRIPPVPTELLPYTDNWGVADIICSLYRKDQSPREWMYAEAYADFRNQVEDLIGDKPYKWNVVDLIDMFGDGPYKATWNMNGDHIAIVIDYYEDHFKEATS